MNLICLHGALGSKEQWNGIGNLLPNTFNVHCLDFPEHGKNDEILNTFSIETLSNSVEQYIKTNQLKNCVIIGYSLGGYVALWLAAKNPEYLVKAITLATKFTWSNDTIAIENAKLSLENLLPIKNKLEAEHGPNFKMLLPNTQQIISSIAQYNLNDKIMAEINIPVLLMVGESDKMVSQQETIHYASFIKNSNVEILPLQPHLIHKMDSEMVKCKIIEFLL